MEVELAALAASAAAMLVQRMAEDGWEQVRGRLARLVARRRTDPDGPATGAAATAQTEADLDATREQLLAARAAGDAQSEADVQAEWRSRLGRALAADPELAAELGALLAELAERESDRAGGNTYNTISGGVQHGTVIQAGTVGDVHIGQPPREPR